MLQSPTALIYVRGRVNKVLGSRVTVKAEGIPPRHNLRPSYTKVSHRTCESLRYSDRNSTLVRPNTQEESFLTHADMTYHDICHDKT